MNKQLLENYLYLLTEDPIMDQLDSEYKKIRLRLLKLGSGPEGSDALSARYRDIPENQIPPEYRKKISDFKRTKDEFDRISNKRSQYSQWVRNGRSGPKPWEYAQSSERMREAGERYRRASRKYEEFMARNRRNNKLFTTSIFVIYVMIVAFNLYKYYSYADRYCLLLVGKKREKCMISSKIKASVKQIESLKRSLPNANNTKNPKEAKKKIMTKINKVNKKIKNLEIQLRKLDE